MAIGFCCSARRTGFCGEYPRSESHSRREFGWNSTPSFCRINWATRAAVPRSVRKPNSVGLRSSRERTSASCSPVRKRGATGDRLGGPRVVPAGPVGGHPLGHGDRVDAEEVGHVRLGEAVQDLADGHLAAGFLGGGGQLRLVVFHDAEESAGG